jgi:murein DD-endopeptidase MepM/ murein hydrolase activator NlpD
VVPLRPTASLALTGVLAAAFLPVALLVLALLAPHGPCQPASSMTPSATDRQLTIVGDSITVAATSDLRARFPAATIAAKGSMPWSWGADQLRRLQAGGTLAPVAAVLLGTNQGITPAQITTLLTTYPNVTLVLMTVSVPFGYQTTTNAAVTAAARHHPGRILVADWHARVATNPALLGPDHIHPLTPASTQAFADTVAAAAAAPAAPAAASDTSPGPPPPWTQAQMTAAVAHYDPAQAQALGAIAMAETGGHAFPSVNPTGVYHGPWAFQEASNPGLDFHRLDTDLPYAAQHAATLAATGITHQKWETWPTLAQKYLHRPATGADGATLTHTASDTTSCAAAAAFAAGPGGTASAAGWTFPLRTTQTAIRRGSQTATGQTETWCYTSLTNCHHDYNAADIMAPTGTPVLSPVSGVVEMTHTAPSNDCMGLDNRGDQISIKGDDGHAYYLGHFLKGSLHVKTGDRITSGQPIAQVGTIGNAQCTVPHLHIQQNPAGDYGDQQNPINIQPILVKLFHRLPS